MAKHVSVIDVNSNTIPERIDDNFGYSDTLQELNIVSDAITATIEKYLYEVHPETGSADILNTLTDGSKIGQIVTLIPNSGDSITVKHNVDNILLDGSVDFTINNNDTLTLIWQGTHWREIGRANIA